ALHDLGGWEAEAAAGVDGGWFAGLGVAAHAGAFFTDLEDAEPRQLDRLALFKRVDDQVQRALDQSRAFLSGQPDFLVDRFAQIRPGKGVMSGHLHLPAINRRGIEGQNGRKSKSSMRI